MHDACKWKVLIQVAHVTPELNAHPELKVHADEEDYQEASPLFHALNFLTLSRVFHT